ncbi:MAG TPA: DUF3857 and transglutaminase domain-containing protein, partial [Syntrophorhabdaceae bacterium]|nr:DUF3857 and transglutaminase domain-containing protein [Syntrophorhabdaceae bacterium]
MTIKRCSLTNSGCSGINGLIPSICVSLWLVWLTFFAGTPVYGYDIPGFSEAKFKDTYREFGEERKRQLVTKNLNEQSTLKSGFKSEVVYRHLYLYIHRDGSTDTYYDIAQKANSPDTKQMIGEPGILFDSSRETVSFLKAVVYTHSGREVESDTMEAIEKSPFTGLVYSDLKVKSLSVKGLEDGAVVRVAYRRTSKPTEEMGFIHERINMAVGIPLKESISVIEIESGTPVTISEKLKKAVTDIQKKDYKLENGNSVYIYKATNLRPEEKELFSVPLPEYSNHISLLTPTTWDNIARWYHGKSIEMMNPDKEITGKARELTDSLKNEPDRIKALYDYVRNIRYVSITLDQHRLIPHEAPATFRNQYGDCKDKSTLLISLLKSIGIRSYICLVNTRTLIDKSEATPKAFNHAIVAIPYRGFYTFLDPTSTTTPYGYTPQYLEHRNGLIIKEGEGDFVLIPADGPDKEAQSVSIKMEIISLTKAKIAMRTVLDGSSDLAKAFDGVSTDRIKQNMARLMSARFGETHVESIDVRKGHEKEKEQLITDLTIVVENALKKMGDFYSIQGLTLSN